MKQVCSIKFTILELWKLRTNLNSELVEFLQSPTFSPPSFFAEHFCLCRDHLFKWKPSKLFCISICWCLGALPEIQLSFIFIFLGALRIRHLVLYKKLMESEWKDVSRVIFYRNLSSSFPSCPASRHYLRKAELCCREKYKTSFEFSGK